MQEDKTAMSGSNTNSNGNNNGSGAPNDGEGMNDMERFRRNKDAILFVGNLPFQTPWQHVKDYFGHAGKVRYTDLIADRTGRPKGSALVTMMTPEGAQKAIAMFNEAEFEGRRLIVRLFDEGPRPAIVQRNMMPPYSANGSNANNGGNGRGRGSPYGGNGGGYGNGGGFGGGNSGAHNGMGGGNMPYNGNPRGGYGGHMGDDMMLQGGGDVEPVPKPRSQQVSDQGRKLFVSNLPFDCTSAALRETFQQVGHVERAEIILGKNMKSRGMGIVVMQTEEEARVAISEFDGIEMANRAMSVRLDIKYN
ncbi:RNA-binding protein [Strigomonas culicis]|uniref:RNA-binding protein n=1 Tax=Strigomonas culicis TaxID=28005 RepID=S9V577_9TRYP|nr:RNA-binding protein [Strigomonas culicis]|eukprot:EPY36214.1 RNA-binding protein [Strigomonas culicis]